MGYKKSQFTVVQLEHIFDMRNFHKVNWYLKYDNKYAEFNLFVGKYNKNDITFTQLNIARESVKSLNKKGCFKEQVIDGVKIFIPTKEFKEFINQYADYKLNIMAKGG